jgi:hypothetical protein
MAVARKDTLSRTVQPRDQMRRIRVVVVEAAEEAVVVDVDVEEAILEDKGLKRTRRHQKQANPIPDRKKESHRNGVEFVVTGHGVIAPMILKIVQIRSMLLPQTPLHKILINTVVPLNRTGPIMMVSPTDQDLVDSRSLLMQRIFKKPVRLPTVVADERHIHTVDICHACPEGDRAIWITLDVILILIWSLRTGG